MVQGAASHILGPGGFAHRTAEPQPLSGNNRAYLHTVVATVHVVHVSSDVSLVHAVKRRIRPSEVFPGGKFGNFRLGITELQTQLQGAPNAGSIRTQLSVQHQGILARYG